MQKTDHQSSSQSLLGSSFTVAIEQLLREMLEVYRRTNDLWGHANSGMDDGTGREVLPETAMLLFDSRHAVLNATILMSASLCCQKVECTHAREVLDALQFLTSEYDRTAL